MEWFLKYLNSFYFVYLKEHNNKWNLALHFTGATVFFLLMFLAFYLGHLWLAPLAVLAGYVLPGIGHARFQRNKSFRTSEPVLCVLCAFKLYIDILTFRLKKKLRIVEARY